MGSNILSFDKLVRLAQQQRQECCTDSDHAPSADYPQAADPAPEGPDRLGPDRSGTRIEPGHVRHIPHDLEGLTAEGCTEGRRRIGTSLGGQVTVEDDLDNRIRHRPQDDRRSEPRGSDAEAQPTKAEGALRIPHHGKQAREHDAPEPRIGQDEPRSHPRPGPQEPHSRDPTTAGTREDHSPARPRVLMNPSPSGKSGRLRMPTVIANSGRALTRVQPTVTAPRVLAAPDGLRPGPGG
jgi:hypothetical protein